MHITRTILALSLVVAATASAEIIHVPGDHSSIQQAINFSSKGDEIIVGPGTYQEEINFLGQGIYLHSSDGAAATVIEGEGALVTFASNETADSILEGFTIANASVGIDLFNNVSPTIRYCIVSGNGKGMSAIDGSSPLVAGCSFLDNFAAIVSETCIFCTSGGPIIKGCVFVGNGGGGAIRATGSILTVDNSIFSNNSSIGGGAIRVFSSSGAPSLTSINHCAFIGNTGTFSGGAIFQQGGDLFVGNSLFYQNATEDFGGGIYIVGNFVGDGNLGMDGCTLVQNTSGNGGGLASGSPMEVANSLLWLNLPNQILDFPGTGEVHHSDVHGGWDGPGENNINANPRFVDFEAGDFRLLPDSPCIDQGDNGAVPEDVTTDLDGNPRIIDGDADGGATVDMGAYEFQVCLADLDGNGVVRVPDLIALLGAWGPNEGHPADLDGDGEVRVPDLIILLAAWGECR